MATLSTSPELTSMDAFCATLFGAGQMRDACSQHIAERLCAVGHYRSLGKGVELPADPQEDRLVFVATGHAKLVSSHGKADGGDGAASQILAFHFPGDMVSVVRQEEGALRLAALSELDLIVFASDQFLDVAQDDPALIRTVLSNSLQALTRSRARMMQMGHKSARQRITAFLASMAERMCGCTCGECTMDLPMTRRDIGDSLGLTIETVSRQLAELREAGLVTTQGRSRVTLHDVRALVGQALGGVDAGRGAQPTKMDQVTGT